jgi:hypothetical protein
MVVAEAEVVLVAEEVSKAEVVAGVPVLTQVHPGATIVV